MSIKVKSLSLIVIVLFLVSACDKSNHNGNITVPEPSGVDLEAIEEQLDSVDMTSGISDPDDIMQSDRIADTRERLQRRLEDSQTGTSEPMRYRLDVAPYSKFLDEEGYLSLNGRSLSDLQAHLGDPPVLVRQSVPNAPLRREVRVYMPYEKDPTGLYIFIENERVVNFRMDEFNGLRNSSLLDYFN